MQAYLTLALLMVGSRSWLDDVLSPVEARKHLNQSVVVEMTVRAAKNRLEKRGEIYLDSELDFHDPRNLGVVIMRTGAGKFKAIQIDDPAQYFRGKKIRVTGVVTEKEGQPRIEVNDPKRIQIVEKSAKDDGKVVVTPGMAEVAEPVLYFETAGKGEPVIFIHGGQLDRRMWDDQFREFAKQFKVIRYDVRGYGKSEMPTKPYSDTNDLHSLLRFLHIDKAYLVGLSLGGRIAIDFALEHPEMVHGLVLAGPGLSGFEWSAEGEKRAIEIDLAARDKGPEEAVRLWLKDPYMAPAMERAELAERVRALAEDNARCWLSNPLLARRISPPAAKRLTEIRVPTLIVVGDRDVPDIQAIVSLLEKKIAGSEKIVMQGAGHMVNMEKPDEFNRAVLRFLRRQRPTK